MARKRRIPFRERYKMLVTGHIPPERRRIVFILLILMLISPLGIISNVIVTNSGARYLKESDTTEYEATVTEVKLAEEGTTPYITIGTKEYGDDVSLSGIPKSVDINDVMGLQSGQRIFFRIHNWTVDLFEEQHICRIITLRTSEKEILSLEDYDEAPRPLSGPIETGIAISVGILTAIFAIYCLLKLRKPTKQNEENTETPLDVNQEAP